MGAMGYDALVANAEASNRPPPGGEKIEFGGVIMLKYFIPAGTILVSHCHVYDHPSILAWGNVELWTQAEGLKELVGPAEVKIAAGVKHAIAAVTDAVWYCLHAGEPQVQKKGE